MAGETQTQETTTNFDDYAKARGAGKENIQQSGESLEDLNKARERQRDDKGRFASENKEAGEKGNVGPTGDTGDAGDTGDNMGWVKKRVERERKKLKAKDQEIAQLKAQLAEGKSPETGEQTQTNDGVKAEAPKEPNRDDFEVYDAYIDAMVDYWEAEELYQENLNAGVSQQTDEKQEAKADAKEEVDEQKADEKAEVLDQPSDYDDLLEILDEHPESDNFYDDFRIAVDEGKIPLPESVIDWLLINEDKAANVVRAFIEKPRTARNVARQVGARQEQTLNRIASGYEPGQADSGGATPPSLNDIRGASRAPDRALEDVNDFSDYKSRRKEQGKLDNAPFGWN